MTGCLGASRHRRACNVSFSQAEVYATLATLSGQPSASNAALLSGGQPRADALGSSTAPDSGGRFSAQPATESTPSSAAPQPIAAPSDAAAASTRSASATGVSAAGTAGALVSGAARPSLGAGSKQIVTQVDVEDGAMKRLPPPRSGGKSVAATVNVPLTFSERVFPTPLRESRRKEEQEWLERNRAYLERKKAGTAEGDGRDFAERDGASWLGVPRTSQSLSCHSPCYACIALRLSGLIQHA